MELSPALLSQLLSVLSAWAMKAQPKIQGCGDASDPFHLQGTVGGVCSEDKMALSISH